MRLVVLGRGVVSNLEGPVGQCKNFGFHFEIGTHWRSNMI